MSNLKYFIFGSNSFIAKKLAKHIGPKKAICFSRSNVENLETFKIDYDKSDYLNHIRNNLKNEKPIFIFANAISDKKILVEISQNEIDKILNVNLCLPINITRNILKKFIYKKPSFIYLSSSRGFSGDKGISIYSTTKNGLEGFSRSLAKEYGKLGIIFRTIHIGLFDGGLKSSELNEKKANLILSKTANNDYVNEENFFKAVEFAATDIAGNGSILKCDNGYF